MHVHQRPNLEPGVSLPVWIHSHYVQASRTQSRYRVMPIFRNAPTTSTSSHCPGSSAVFFAWMYARVLRKCRVIMSGVATPSILCEGWRYEEDDDGEVIVSIDEVMSSTSETINLGVIWHNREYDCYPNSRGRNTHCGCTSVEVIQILFECVAIKLNSDDLIRGRICYA